MQAAKTLAKLLAAAKAQKAGKLLAAAEALNSASEDDLELVQELVSNIEELENPEVAKARARTRHAAKLARGVRASTQAGELEDEEELATEEDEELSPSAIDLARVLSATEDDDTETAEDLDGEEADADVEEVDAEEADDKVTDETADEGQDDQDGNLDDFDVTSAKVAATRRAIAKVQRAKASAK